MFVQISHYQVVNKFMGDIHMINKVKNYICEKISKMFSDNNSKFDFTAYLVNIGFIYYSKHHVLRYPLTIGLYFACFYNFNHQLNLDMHYFLLKDSYDSHIAR